MEFTEALDRLRDQVIRFEDLLVKRFASLRHTWAGNYGLEKWGTRVRLMYRHPGTDARPWADCSTLERMAVTAIDLRRLYTELEEQQRRVSSEAERKIDEIAALVASLDK